MDELDPNNIFGKYKIHEKSIENELITKETSFQDYYQFEFINCQLLYCIFQLGLLLNQKDLL